MNAIAATSRSPSSQCQSTAIRSPPDAPESDLSAQPLIIVCAGGYGRETATAVVTDDRWELLGFADDDPALHGEEIAGVRVLGAPEIAIERAPEAHVVVSQAR